ncbi:hypothetical protein BKA70DRAFT_1114809, partial [Coprinopsis sp. MPI-PUGE-AT-0042]
FMHLYPPVRSCMTDGCSGACSDPNILTLTEPRSHPATLFTLNHGALPIYTTSLYCRGCLRRYHHNYVLHNRSESRTFYPGVPEVIQVAQHFFFEARLLEFFANGKVFGWLSSLNCARIYNQSLAHTDAYRYNNRLAFAGHQLPPSNAEQYHMWPTSLKIREEDVLNGFFLYSLLLDHAERNVCLLLSDDASSQRDRLQGALEKRNKRMQAHGQEQYFHACDLCFRTFERDGQICTYQSLSVCAAMDDERHCMGARR